MSISKTPTDKFNYIWTPQDAVAVQSSTTTVVTPYAIDVKRIPNAKGLRDGDCITIDPKASLMTSTFWTFLLDKTEYVWSELSKESNLANASTIGDLFSLMATDDIHYPSILYRPSKAKGYNIRRIYEYWGNTEYRHAIIHTSGFSPSTIDTLGDHYPIRPNGPKGAPVPLKYILKRKTKDVPITAAPTTNIQGSNGSSKDTQTIRYVTLDSSIKDYTKNVHSALAQLSEARDTLNKEMAARGATLAALDVAVELMKLVMWSRRTTSDGVNVYTDLFDARERARTSFPAANNAVSFTWDQILQGDRVQTRETIVEIVAMDASGKLCDDLHAVSNRLVGRFDVHPQEVDDVAELFRIVSDALHDVDAPRATARIAQILNQFSSQAQAKSGAALMDVPKGDILTEIFRLAGAISPTLAPYAVPKKIASAALALRLAYIQTEIASGIESVIDELSRRSSSKLGPFLDALHGRLQAFAPEHGSKIIKAIVEGDVNELDTLKTSLGKAIVDERTPLRAQGYATLNFLFATFDILIVINKYAKSGYPSDQLLKNVLSLSGASDAISAVQWGLTTAQFVATIANWTQTASKFAGWGSKVGKFGQVVGLVCAVTGGWEAFQAGDSRRTKSNLVRATSSVLLLSGTKDPWVLGVAYALLLGAIVYDSHLSAVDGRKPPVNKQLYTLIHFAQQGEIYAKLRDLDYSINDKLNSIKDRAWFSLDPDSESPSLCNLWMVDNYDVDIQVDSMTDDPLSYDEHGRVLSNQLLVRERLARLGISSSQVDELCLSPEMWKRRTNVDIQSGEADSGAGGAGAGGAPPGYY